MRRAKRAGNAACAYKRGRGKQAWARAKLLLRAMLVAGLLAAVAQAQCPAEAPREVYDLGGHFVSRCGPETDVWIPEVTPSAGGNVAAAVPPSVDGMCRPAGETTQTCCVLSTQYQSLECHNSDAVPPRYFSPPRNFGPCNATLQSYVNGFGNDYYMVDCTTTEREAPGLAAGVAAGAAAFVVLTAAAAA